MKKSAKKKFVYNENQSEYVITLRKRCKPCWLLLLLLLTPLLLLFFIKDDTIKVKFCDVDQKGEFIADASNKIYINGQFKETLEGDCFYVEAFPTDTIKIEGMYKKLVNDSLIDGSKTLKELQDLSQKYRNIMFILKEETIVEDQVEPQPPKENCRIFITDLLVGDEYEDYWVSEAYVIDKYSDYVGAGHYPNSKTAFPNASQGTFDGIAIAAKTRVIIYSKTDFKGEILLDRTGPLIINNSKHRDSKPTLSTKTYKEPLQSLFPQASREWSEVNMNDWSNGSIKVICN